MPPNFRFPTLQELPLHGTVLEPGQYWACTEPERPYEDNITWWDWRCRPCVRHAEKTLRHVGDFPQFGDKGDGTVVLSASLRLHLKVAKKYFRQQGRPL